jgi:hypothetical protein
MEIKIDVEQSKEQLTRLEERKLYLQQRIEDFENELGWIENEIAACKGIEFESLMDLPSIRRALATHKKREEFEPIAHYNQAGDQVEIVTDNETYYGSHKPDGICRMINKNTEKVTGFTILGVSNWIRRLNEGKGIQWVDKAPEWDES